MSGFLFLNSFRKYTGKAGTSNQETGGHMAVSSVVPRVLYFQLLSGMNCKAPYRILGVIGLSVVGHCELFQE